LFLAVAVLLVRPAQAADKVVVAAAANLVYVLEPLRAEFERQSPGAVITVETGASGNLVAMIRNGAPYDVFLSADLEYPRKLIAARGAEADSLTTFAYGRLVLWTTREQLPFASVEAVIFDPQVAKIAIANPDTAPFGRAAEEALTRFGRTDAVAAKLVYAQDIGQTAHYVLSGNADVGFVALSLVMAPKLRHTGRWLEVPPDSYQPIAEGAVVTRHGAANASARKFLEFLGTPAARAILREYGYGVP
jgi:molybdate transport system substrate-binding protein